MAKEKTAYRCRECGATAPRWEGRCHACGDWNTLVEEAHRPKRTQLEPSARPVPVADVSLASGIARPTHIDELDRVLGGGLVPGSVTLLGGEPGIGKSTLLLQALTSLARRGNRCHSLLLRPAVKHRFGATVEIVLFEMRETGLSSVADPAALLLADRQHGVPGCVVTPVLEGQRPLLVEVQGLVSTIADDRAVNPVRSSQGLDPKRLAVLLAVLDAR